MSPIIDLPMWTSQFSGHLLHDCELVLVLSAVARSCGMRGFSQLVEALDGYLRDLRRSRRRPVLPSVGQLCLRVGIAEDVKSLLQSLVTDENRHGTTLRTVTNSDR